MRFHLAAGMACTLAACTSMTIASAAAQANDVTIAVERYTDAACTANFPEDDELGAGHHACKLPNGNVMYIDIGDARDYLSVRAADGTVLYEKPHDGRFNQILPPFGYSADESGFAVTFLEQSGFGFTRGIVRVDAGGDSCLIPATAMQAERLAAAMATPCAKRNKDEAELGAIARVDGLAFYQSQADVTSCFIDHIRENATGDDAIDRRERTCTSPRGYGLRIEMRDGQQRFTIRSDDNRDAEPTFLAYGSQPALAGWSDGSSTIDGTVLWAVRWPFAEGGLGDNVRGVLVPVETRVASGDASDDLAARIDPKVRVYDVHAMEYGPGVTCRLGVVASLPEALALLKPGERGRLDCPEAK